MKKNKIIILSCRGSLVVRRIHGYWEGTNKKILK
jgi:hypothetical protein